MPKTETITLSMNWKQTLSVCLAVLQDGDEAGRAMAVHELRKMAGAADLAVELTDAARALLSSGDTLTLTPKAGKSTLSVIDAWDRLRAAVAKVKP